MNENDTRLIVSELRKLRVAISILTGAVVLCALAIVLTLRPELMIGVVVFLGLIFAVWIIVGIIGTTAGKAVTRLRNR